MDSLRSLRELPMCRISKTNREFHKMNDKGLKKSIT